MTRVTGPTGLVSLPRVPLATLPTPLVPTPRLSDALGIEVWLKRDDLTGLGLGGNKVRGLEFLLAEALAQGADCLVTGAGPQSNWAALAAVAARVCGLDPFLVYYGDPVPGAGNLLLARTAGADIRFTGDQERKSVDAGTEWLADRLRSEGRRPYLLPRGGATALGSVGYVQATVELADQLRRAGLAPAQLWLATGSCGTQAGLVAGARRLGLPHEVVGVTVSRPAEECRELVARLAAGAGELLGPAGAAGAGRGARRWGAHDRDDVVVLDGWMGRYGRPSPEGAAAARLVARTEGVLLDPVFGAKAMAALVAAAREGITGPVVFLVTGGAPTIFAAGEPA